MTIGLLNNFSNEITTQSIELFSENLTFLDNYYELYVIYKKYFMIFMKFNENDYDSQNVETYNRLHVKYDFYKSKKNHLQDLFRFGKFI